LLTLAARPRELVAVSFVALSFGFAAGWWLARQDRPDTLPAEPGGTASLELGTRALEAGDLALAESHFRAVLARDPDNPRARLELAGALMLQGRWEEAEPELERARELAPDRPEAWFLSGLLWREGFADTAAAREAWRRFLELVPADSPEAATVRAWLAELEAPEETGGD
jgi:tetratricopeptide (TPR) repeat protein